MSTIRNVAIHSFTEAICLSNICVITFDTFEIVNYVDAITCDSTVNFP